MDDCERLRSSWVPRLTTTVIAVENRCVSRGHVRGGEI